MQIKTRLTIQFILIVAGILLFSLFFIYFKFKAHIEDEFYIALQSKAAMTAEMIVKNDTPKMQVTSEPTLMTTFRENILIYDEQNKLVYSFNTILEDIAVMDLNKIRQDGSCRIIHEQFLALGIAYKNKQGKQFVVIAESIFNSDELHNLRNILIFDFFLIIAIVALGGWFFSRQALAPVERIMQQMDAIRPTDLSQRLPILRKDELSHLIEAINSLLHRIEMAFDSQKRFISNVSHELKNPLTVISAQLEVALQKERSETEYQKTITSVLEDTKELSEISDKLLQLAKLNSEHGAIAFERVRLDEIIWQTKTTVLKNHADYKIAFEVLQLPEDESELYVQANEALLRTALLNLIENGCKFSPDKRVKITLNYDSVLLVEIQDQGVGISEIDQKRIFEPFYRSEQTKNTRGSGIGLSLVDSILRLHQIQLEIISQEGKGTTFRLKWS
jgi:signal transduction histidine kinase